MDYEMEWGRLGVGGSVLWNGMGRLGVVTTVEWNGDLEWVDVYCGVEW